MENTFIVDFGSCVAKYGMASQSPHSLRAFSFPANSLSTGSTLEFTPIPHPRSETSSSCPTSPNFDPAITVLPSLVADALAAAGKAGAPAKKKDGVIALTVMLLVSPYVARLDRERAMAAIFAMTEVSNERLRPQGAEKASVFRIVVDRVYVGLSQVAAMYSTGDVSGIVVDVGYTCTNVVCVIGGQAVLSAGARLPTGFHHMSRRALKKPVVADACAERDNVSFFDQEQQVGDQDALASEAVSFLFDAEGGALKTSACMAMSDFRELEACARRPGGGTQQSAAGESGLRMVPVKVLCMGGGALAGVADRLVRLLEAQQGVPSSLILPLPTGDTHRDTPARANCVAARPLLLAASPKGGQNTKAGAGATPHVSDDQMSRRAAFFAPCIGAAIIALLPSFAELCVARRAVAEMLQ